MLRSKICQQKSHLRHYTCAFFLAMHLLLCLLAASFSYAQEDSSIKIGVLAKRGHEQTLKKIEKGSVKITGKQVFDPKEVYKK